MEAERLYTKQPSRTIQQKRGGEGALEMVDNRPIYNCLQLFTMNKNGLVGTVFIDAEEGGVHNGHTLNRHVVNESVARQRLRDDPTINASSFWTDHDSAHNAFREIFSENRSLKDWAGQSNYNPQQTKVKVNASLSGGRIITRNNIKKVQYANKAEGYVYKPNNNPFTQHNPTKQLGLVTLYPTQ